MVAPWRYSTSAVCGSTEKYKRYGARTVEPATRGCGAADFAVSRPIMVILIAGAPLSTGSDNPYCGTPMPVGGRPPHLDTPQFVRKTPTVVKFTELEPKNRPMAYARNAELSSPLSIEPLPPFILDGVENQLSRTRADSPGVRLSRPRAPIGGRTRSRGWTPPIRRLAASVTRRIRH